MEKYPVDLPPELLIEIAKCDWRAYTRLNICNKQLHADLSRLDPYAMFTRRVEGNWDIGAIIHWQTPDGVNIRTIKVMLGGWLSVKLYGKKYLKYTYGSHPYIDDNGVYQHGEFTYKIGEWNATCGKFKTTVVDKNVWRSLRQPWLDLFEGG
jgi:hypothetical protein